MHSLTRPKRSVGGDLMLLGMAVIIGLGIGLGLLWVFEPNFFRGAPPANDPTAGERAPDPRTGRDVEEREAIDLFKHTKDSVVNVDVVVRVRSFDAGVREQQASGGSGFIWDDDGRVVTNFHVVRDALDGNGPTLRVVLSDHSTYAARIVGATPDYDLAVIQILDAPKEKFKKIRVGTSKDLEVGQKVFAIGNPFGLSLTLTKGIISALDREIDSPSGASIPGAIQTDAPINPGNSGGPLLDKDGRLIGVNTAIATPSGGNVGIGFAIPVDTVNAVATELIKRGRLLRPDVGIKLVDQWRVRRAGFPNGVMIADVTAGSPADKAGLVGLRKSLRTGDTVPGDIVLKINGTAVNANLDFTRTILNSKPGDKLKFTIDRDGEQSEVEVTVRGI
jgi:S1-C subfamily serine protease